MRACRTSCSVWIGLPGWNVPTFGSRLYGAARLFSRSRRLAKILDIASDFSAYPDIQAAYKWWLAEL